MAAALRELSSSDTDIHDGGPWSDGSSIPCHTRACQWLKVDAPEYGFSIGGLKVTGNFVEIPAS